jgi:hypothetical protein
VARHLEKSGKAVITLTAGTRLPLTAAPLGESGVRLTARLCWLPPSHTPPGYALELTAGAAGCGGAADEGTSEAKRAAMVAAWGEANGTEWRPEGPYDPCSTERMFALEDIGDEFCMWQETYARDPIYSQLSTAPPPLKIVLPIYGINKPSLAGAIYRRKVAKWRQGERTCYLTLDETATVLHPGCAPAGSSPPLFGRIKALPLDLAPPRRECLRMPLCVCRPCFGIDATCAALSAPGGGETQP